MKDVHHFDIRISADGSPPSVIMDDIPIRGVRSFMIDSSYDNTPTVTLTLTASSNVSGRSQVRILDIPKCDGLAEIQNRGAILPENVR